jgi:hypothetical protein
MRRAFLSTLALGALVSLFLAASAYDAHAAATIVILNNDGASTGFNDPTPVSPVGGNGGTTLGQQRLNAFQFAGNIWGATLNSNVTITIRASWAALSCSSNSATLGQAGAIGIFRDFPNAPVAGTWYPAALANALSGTDLDPNTPEISAQFNSNLGNTGCLDGTHFYLGLDNNHGNDVDLVTVLMHEFGHGLGFQTYTNTSTGAQASNFPSVYDRFLFDNTTQKTWVQMTATERQASAINSGNLVWNGGQVTADASSTLGTPRLRVNSPGSIAGNYVVGTADFGPHVTSSGVTANVTQASPGDGCTALTNAMSGRIALIDRGSCTFVTKVKNAQNAGAVGVIVANNTSGVIEMGGGDATIVIPSLMVSLSDGSTIKSQLTAGVNASLLLDTSVPSGTDGAGRPRLFAPGTIQSGSSVSHWDTVLFPNQLMEPDISGDLSHSVTAPLDLTTSQMVDIGWTTGGAVPTPTPSNPIDTPDFFVRQHYQDFLNRQADPSGLAFWVNEITSCGSDQACIDAKRVNVSAAFYLSIEFQQTGFLVERMYKTAYGDAVGTSTLNGTHLISVPVVRFDELIADSQFIGQNVVVGQPGWDTILESNKQAYANQFVSLSRFTSAYPTSMSAATFVDTLNRNAGNPASSTERNQLVNNLSSGSMTRAQVLRYIAEHQNLINSENNRAFVLMQYFGYLRRNPNNAPDSDYSGFDFWLTKLNQFNGNYQSAEMVKAFITSAEYRHRFGP